MKIEELKKGLIVSCQATPDEPMFGSDVMAKFALAAQMGGAVGVRVNSVPDILAVKNMVDLPVIGIIKRDYPDSVCRITPTMREVEAVYMAGAEIVAVECTFSARPNGERLDELMAAIKQRFPDMLLMADVATVEEGVYAWEHGADIVATTMAGEDFEDDPNIIPEFQPPSLDILGELCKKVTVPVIGEGRFFGSENTIEAFKLGAHNVVIGAGITRPQIITKRVVTDIAPYLAK